MSRLQRTGRLFIPSLGVWLADDGRTQVTRAYETQGFDVLLKAFNELGFLEKLTGLDKLHEEGEAALEAVDWEEEDDF